MMTAPGTRRAFLARAPGFAIGVVAGWTGAPSWAQPHYAVSSAQLQRIVAERFPVRFAVADLFDIDVQAPQLRLLPDLNRLGGRMVLQAAGPALRRSYRGSFDVDFALRYEAADRSIRAHQLRVHSLRVPEVPSQTLMLFDAYAQALAERSLLEVVVHRLRPRDLALADAMGLQPGDITVTGEGLEIGFVPKPR